MVKCNLCGLKRPLLIAGASAGLSILGNKQNFGGVVPDEVSSGLSSAGATTSGFVGPAVNIVAAGYVVKQLRGLKNGL